MKRVLFCIFLMLQSVTVTLLPAQNKVDLGNQVSGTLPVISGGTGLGTLTVHCVMLGAGTGNLHFACPSSAGNVLTDNGASADPTFQAPTVSGGTVTSVDASAPVVAIPSPITGTGTISCPTCLTAAVTTVTATAPVVATPSSIVGTGDISCPTCLTAAVTSLTATAPVVVTPSTVTATGVLSCPTCVIGPSTASGSIIGGFIGQTLGGGTTVWPPYASVGATSNVIWPTPGFMRNAYIYLGAQTTNNFPRVFLSKNGQTGWPSFIPAYALNMATSAGTFGDTNSSLRVETGDHIHFHINTPDAIAAGTTPTVTAWSAEFVPDSNVTLVGGHTDSTNNMGAGVTSFAPIFGNSGGADFSTTEKDKEFVVPFAGTVSNFFFVTGSVSQPATGTAVVTIMKNEGATAVTFTVPINGTVGLYGDITHNFVVAAGDRLDFKIVNNSSGTSTSFFSWSFIIAPTAGSNKAIIGATIGPFTATAGTTNFSTPMVNKLSTTEANQRFPMPRGGTLGNCFAYVKTASTSNTTTLTIMKNGSAGSSTVSIGAGTSGLLTGTGTDAIARGDYIDMRIASVGGTGPVISSWGCDVE